MKTLIKFYRKLKFYLSGEYKEFEKIRQSILRDREENLIKESKIDLSRAQHITVEVEKSRSKIVDSDREFEEWKSQQ